MPQDTLFMSTPARNSTLTARRTPRVLKGYDWVIGRAEYEAALSFPDDPDDREGRYQRAILHDGFPPALTNL